MRDLDPLADFDLADQVAGVSSELLRFRVRHRQSLSVAQRRRLEQAETELDRTTARLRGRGASSLAALTEGALQELQAATAGSQALLRRIRRTERALQLAAAVIALGAAAARGRPDELLSALRALKGALSQGAASG